MGLCFQAGVPNQNSSFSQSELILATIIFLTHFSFLEYCISIPIQVPLFLDAFISSNKDLAPSSGSKLSTVIQRFGIKLLQEHSRKYSNLFLAKVTSHCSFLYQFTLQKNQSKTLVKNGLTSKRRRNEKIVNQN